MFTPILPMPVRTGLTTTRRYPQENGFTTEVINPLLNPHMARLKDSMGSLNPYGRTMASPGGLGGTLDGVELVEVGAATCAEAVSKSNDSDNVKHAASTTKELTQCFNMRAR